MGLISLYLEKPSQDEDPQKAKQAVKNNTNTGYSLNSQEVHVQLYRQINVIYRKDSGGKVASW